MKIKQHDLYAEIIPDKVVVYNYIVRRVGMDEILYWGKENRRSGPESSQAPIRPAHQQAVLPCSNR